MEVKITGIFKGVMEQRQCTKCGIVKDLIEFSRHTKGKGGRNSICSSCVVESVKVWQKNNPEKVKRNARKNWKIVKKDPEKRARKNRELLKWRQKNRERHLQHIRDYKANKLLKTLNKSATV